MMYPVTQATDRIRAHRLDYACLTICVEYKESKEPKYVTKAPSQQRDLLAIPDVGALCKGAHLSK